MSSSREYMQGNKPRHSLCRSKWHSKGSSHLLHLTNKSESPSFMEE